MSGILHVGAPVRLRRTGEIGKILTSNRTCGTVVYGVTLNDGRTIVAREDFVTPIAELVSDDWAAA